MITRPRHVHALPVIDVRQNGMGDVVVAAWLIHSALAAGIHLLLNARQQRHTAEVLSVPSHALTTSEADDWSTTPGLGHQYEYGRVTDRPLSRFNAWCEALHLPPLAPRRPPYHELTDDGEWAQQAWRTVSNDSSQPRLLVFPDTAWSIRAWPRAYFIDLVNDLRDAGCAVAAMSSTSSFVSNLSCHWWAGFSTRQVAAMAARATLVVANDSGPAHLAAAIGTQTLAVCGPTDPRIVFAHEPNVRALWLDERALECSPCHFSTHRGFRRACEVGGCQALMRLDPQSVAQAVYDELSAVSRNEARRA